MTIPCGDLPLHRQGAGGLYSHTPQKLFDSMQTDLRQSSRTKPRIFDIEFWSLQHLHNQTRPIHRVAVVILTGVPDVKNVMIRNGFVALSLTIGVVQIALAAACSTSQ